MSNPEHIAGIRALRSQTGASMRECKHALESASGDVPEARALIEQRKLERVQREAGCSSDEAAAALAHAKGVVERAVEVARMPSIVVEHEFVRVTNRARRFLAERAAALGLYELRDVLPHANKGPAVARLALVLEFHSIMATCDIETILEDEDNDAEDTLAALEEVGEVVLAEHLRRVLDGPRHLDARETLNQVFLTREGPLLAAVLRYIDRNPGLAP